MTRSRSVLERLKERGEEVLTQISNEVVASPYFAKAMEGAMKGKERLDQAVGQALKQMNIPTRSEFKRAVHRIEQLEQELAAMKAQASTPAAPRPRAKRTRKGTTRAE
jgi:polyhydroxyalkanoate synthesis regulator phasin